MDENRKQVVCSTSDSNEAQPQYHSFKFPRMQLGSMWPDVNRIKRVIAREVADRNDPRLASLFFVKYKPHKIDHQQLRLLCMHCSSFLTFTRTDQGYQLTELANDHVHRLESVPTVNERSPTAEQVFEEFRAAVRQNQSLDQIKFRLMDRYSVTYEDFKVLRQRFQDEEIDDLPNFYGYLR